MKVHNLFYYCIFLFSFCIFGCVDTVKKRQVQKEESQKEESQEELRSGFNEIDIANYAKCVNELAVQNQIGTFLWDCSTHMDRNKMKISFPKYIEAIMSCYPKKSDFGNGGNDSVFEEEDAKTAVANFGAGWNLGNTLDAHSFNISKVGTDEELGWIPKWGKKDSNGNYYPSNWETAWGQPETNEKIVDFILDAGFNAIRIPITWAEHFDKNDNVDPIWMNRVKETVDLFYNKGVYCIINAHHDGGTDGWIEATETSYNKYSSRFEKLWQQIANTFADYDERLLFESMNEVLDENNEWNNPSAAGLEYVNKWNQLFVDTVRATGGNNSKRNLVVMTYAGGGDENRFTRFVLPNDSVKNHLIVEVHNYNPMHFTWTDVTWKKMTAIWSDLLAQELRKDFKIYKKYSDVLGVPFIVGEYNADPKLYEEYDK